MIATKKKQFLIFVVLITGAVILSSEMALASPGKPGHHATANEQAGHMHHGSHGETLAGHPGNPEDVERTIVVKALDSMVLKMESPLQVKDGETIKFVVTNEGNIKHEFSIATKEEHVEHGAMMMENPSMHHPVGGNTISMAPGETQTIIWTFEEAWQVEVACNLPGHYQAGMYNEVEFVE